MSRAHDTLRANIAWQNRVKGCATRLAVVGKRWAPKESRARAEARRLFITYNARRAGGAS